MARGCDSTSLSLPSVSVAHVCCSVCAAEWLATEGDKPQGIPQDRLTQMYARAAAGSSLYVIGSVGFFPQVIAAVGGAMGVWGALLLLPAAAGRTLAHVQSMF